MDCAFCGRDFSQVKVSQKYCSARCRSRRFNADAPDKIHGQKSCLNCGESFLSNYSKAKFCKPQCHWKFANSNRPTTKYVDRSCPVCEAVFKPEQKRGVGKMCCSTECTSVWRQKYKPNYLAKVEKRKKFLSDLREYGRTFRKEKPDQAVCSGMRKNYGITLEQYNEMLEKQNGVCAICKNPETSVDGKSKKVRRLAIDHNHQTGKVRKLLCGRCNKALGGFKENLEAMQSAIEYLKQHIFDT